MAFHGKNKIGSKISLKNITLKQVIRLKYLSYKIIYYIYIYIYIYDRNIENKLRNFIRICETIRRTLDNQCRKETLLKSWHLQSHGYANIVV